MLSLGYHVTQVLSVVPDRLDIHSLALLHIPPGSLSDFEGPTAQLGPRIHTEQHFNDEACPNCSPNSHRLPPSLYAKPGQSNHRAVTPVLTSLHHPLNSLDNMPMSNRPVIRRLIRHQVRLKWSRQAFPRQTDETRCLIFPALRYRGSRFHIHIKVSLAEVSGILHTLNSHHVDHHAPPRFPLPIPAEGLRSRIPATEPSRLRSTEPRWKVARKSANGEAVGGI